VNDSDFPLIGNAVEDPVLRHTDSGIAYVRFRIASTPRFRDNRTGQWKDGNTVYLDCVAWRDLAEHVATTIRRGVRVIAIGRLTQRTYRQQTITELECDEVGPSLRWATAIVTRSTRAGAADPPVLAEAS
jgi:single-strand DNA-binding protein